MSPRARPMDFESPPASLAEIVDALRALGLEPSDDLRFHESVKPRYKRLAQRHHPDRTRSCPPSEARAHSEAFARAKRAYELAEAELAAGRWPPEAFRGMGPAPAGPPAVNPGPKEALELALAEFQAACSAMAGRARAGDLDGGARALAARCASMAASAPWPPALMPWARLGFLRSLWSLPQPGMVRMASMAMPLLREAGLPGFAAAVDPSAESFAPAGCPPAQAFDLPSSVAKAALDAGPAPGPGASSFWRSLPAAFGSLSDPARAVCAFPPPGENLMVRLLRESPRAAEALAPFCDRAALATPAWLAACCSSEADPAPFLPWFDPLPLDSILAAARCAGPAPFARWRLALAGRIGRERRADLADFPGAPPELAEPARALSDLARIEASCSRSHLPQEPFEAAYDPSAGAARKAFERALAGDADGMASLILHAERKGLDATRLLGTPIACALAAKAWLRPDMRAPLLACLARLPEPMRRTALSERDARGASAASWLAKMGAAPSSPFGPRA